MATIIKVGDKYRAQIRRKGITRSATFPKKGLAEVWARQIEADIEAQRVGRLPDRMLTDLFERYILEVSPKKRTGGKEELRIRKFMGDSEFTGVPLKSVSPRIFTAWRDRRLKEVSTGSVLREMNILSAICSTAVKEWEWLNDNPLAKVTRPEPPKPRSRRPTDDEMAAIVKCLGYAQGGKLETTSSRIGAMALFAVETAMRSGEICAMRWEDVHLDDRYVHIPMSKNGKARNVPLSQVAIQIIQQLSRDADTVFNVKSDIRDTLWRKATAKAGVSDLHFHDLRREGATRLSEIYNNVMELSSITGHMGVNILNRVYYANRIEDTVQKLKDAGK